MNRKPTYEALEQRVKELEKEREENNQIEDEFVKRQQYLESVFHHVPDAIITLDSSHRVIDWNPGAQIIFGYSSDEARGKKIDDLVSHPDVEQEAHDNTRKVLSGQLLKPIESVCYRKDGTSVHVITSGAPIIIDNVLKGAVAVYTDISGRKQAEEEFRKSEEKLKAIFEANPDPVVVYDVNGYPLFLNPAFTEIFGWTLKELQGKRIPFVPDNQQKITHLKIKEIYESGNPVRFETKRLSKQDKTINILLSAAIIKDNHGINTGLVVNLTDITEQKKIENQLRQSQKMEAIGTLAGGIAHDFNNILSGIFGYTQLAVMNINDSVKIKKNLDQVTKGAQRAAELVQQILAFSRQVEYKKNPLALSFIVKEAIKFLHSSIPASIKIQENISSRAMVLADSTQVHQVVMNLCTNAYHAMGHSGGILSVELSDVEITPQRESLPNSCKPGNYVKLEVKDTGHGMNKKTMERIFYPYFTTKKLDKGTGLGLAVVDGIVKKHNGFIKTYSKAGHGSIFQVFWPIIEKKKT